ncbi:ATP-binding cassette domain-containing protein [Spiroplasma endosymbiont of Virgichneumon dumeticola]|uniref:ATP-binding cassette domain-containing protein n=1 Tax=Spiroplasma endosymbiont of Virgichneumon dumeticola TaxID=3139323 RepID=UPI0035C8D186
MSDVMISVKNYNIKFKRFKIPQADFTVYKGTIHALVGQSGSGQSLLLNQLSVLFLVVVIKVKLI